MIGVELVENKAGRQPLSVARFDDIWEETKEAGVLFGRGGFYKNVLRIKPPMCIDKRDVDHALEVLKSALENHCKKYGS